MVVVLQDAAKNQEFSVYNSMLGEIAYSADLDGILMLMDVVFQNAVKIILSVILLTLFHLNGASAVNSVTT